MRLSPRSAFVIRPPFANRCSALVAGPLATYLSLATCLSLVTCQSVASAQSPPPSVIEIPAENCMVRYIRQVNVPAEVEGKLLELKIEEGMNVSKGDVLAIVDDTNAQLALDLRRAQEREASLTAESDVNLRDAVNAEKLALAEAESYRDLYTKGAVPMYEMRKKELEAIRATLRIELAENELSIKEAQYLARRSERQIAEYEIDRRQITAPFDGYVEMRIAQLGEWVQPGTPIATVVMLDRLRVEGDVDALEYAGQITPGMPVRVKVYSELDAGNAIEVGGKIGFVSSEIDLNNHYRVWVDIENQRIENDWAIKPGMKAEIMVKPRKGSL